MKPEISTVDIAKYNLHNKSNYRQTFECNTTDVMIHLVGILTKYIRFISDKNTTKKKEHYKFLFERGIETIFHVFSVIFYSTKNLELTLYHTQESYYFYVEFIEQILDDNTTFLNLSSRDATIFAYDKTIFQLNHEYIKSLLEPSNEDKKLLSVLDMYIYRIYKNILYFIIKHIDFNYETKSQYITTCCNYFEQINRELVKHKIKKNSLEIISILSNWLKDKNIKVEDYFNTLGGFIQNMNNKKKIDEKTLKQKLDELDEMQESNTYILQELDVLY